MIIDELWLQDIDSKKYSTFDNINYRLIFIVDQSAENCYYVLILGLESFIKIAIAYDIHDILLHNIET